MPKILTAREREENRKLQNISARARSKARKGRVTRSYDLPADLMARFDSFAAAMDRSKSELVAEVIEKLLSDSGF